MIVGVDARVHLCAPSLSVLTGVHGVGVQDTGQLNLELDRAILMEDPVHAVFVVCGCEDVGDDEFTGTSDDD